MVTYGPKDRRPAAKSGSKPISTGRSAEDLVRGMKAEPREGHAMEYRDRALEIYGLICGRCSREFEERNRHLLTIHHRDGNHDNNPWDGSNWEPLCVYCHEDVHSRTLLGDYLDGQGGQQATLVYRKEENSQQEGGLGLLGQKLKVALEKKKR